MEVAAGDMGECGMNILIVAVEVLSLFTAFCVGVACGRSWEREDYQFREDITAWEDGEDADYTEDED